MSIKIIYSKKLNKKSSSNLVLFASEKFNINSLKKHLSNSEFSYINDLLKTSDLKKNMFVFEVNSKKKIILISIKKDLKNFDIENLGAETGISAMSISDMTKIPRATIIRKCKYLIKEDLVKLNKKKQYVLTSMNFRKILPYQTQIFKYKAKFIRKILNLLVIS